MLHDLEFNESSACGCAFHGGVLWKQGSPRDGEWRLSAPLASRVRALEERVPGLEARLRKHLNRQRPRPRSGGGTLIRRVELLEEAIDTLWQAQVHS
jgi:hypothetical protein